MKSSLGSLGVPLSFIVTEPLVGKLPIIKLP